MRRITAAALAFIALGAASTAFAAVDDRGPSKFGLKYTLRHPLNSKLRDVDSLWAGIGAEYYLKRDADERPVSYVSLDFVKSEDGVVRGSVIGVSYTKLHRRLISSNRASYTGMGLGLDNLKLESDWASKSGIRPEVHGIYGQEFGKGLFAEIRLDLTSDFNNVNWSAISINLGTRSTF